VAVRSRERGQTDRAASRTSDASRDHEPRPYTRRAEQSTSGVAATIALPQRGLRIDSCHASALREQQAPRSRSDPRPLRTTSERLAQATDHAHFRQAKRQRGALRARRVDVVQRGRLQRRPGDARFHAAGAARLPPVAESAIRMWGRALSALARSVLFGVGWQRAKRGRGPKARSATTGGRRVPNRRGRRDRLRVTSASGCRSALCHVSYHGG
jgi:hypothetical protein